MNAITKAFKERPNALEIVVLIILFLPLSLIFHRFLLQLFAVLMLIAALGVVALKKKLLPVIIYNISTVLCIISLISPLDLAFRASDHWYIKFAKISRRIKHRGSFEKAAAEMPPEQSSVVFYDCPAEMLGPYWAILVTIPTKHNVKTPL